MRLNRMNTVAVRTERRSRHSLFDRTAVDGYLELAHLIGVAGSAGINCGGSKLGRLWLLHLVRRTMAYRTVRCGSTFARRLAVNALRVELGDRLVAGSAQRLGGIFRVRILVMLDVTCRARDTCVDSFHGLFMTRYAAGC